MKRFFLALVALTSSNMALAEEISVRAKVISSDAKIDADSLAIPTLGVQSNLEGEGAEQQAFGYGADVEFLLNEQARLGTGLSYTRYAQEESSSYSDFTWAGYGTYDFFNQQPFAVYGTAGLSYHNLSFDDQEFSGVNVGYDSTGLLNYDLGLGGRARINEQLTFGLEYKYTDTFSKNDVDVTVGGVEAAKLKDISLSKNELVASVSHAF